MSQTQEPGTSVLELIPSDEILTIEALDGQKFICEENGVFFKVDGEFARLRLNKFSEPTPRTVARAYEVVKKANHEQMLVSLSADFSELCFSEHQVERFCEKYPEWLCESGNFLPFEQDGEIYFARVYKHPESRLSVNVFVLRLPVNQKPFEWDDSFKYRLFLPRYF